MKKLLIFITVLLSALSFGCKKNQTDNNSASGQAQLIMGLDDSFPPMGFRGDNNEIVGFDIDLAKEVTKKLNMELVLQPIDWGTKELELNSGKITCIWNGLSVSPERQEAMALSKPYLANKMVIITTADSPINTKADLEGKNVGLQTGSTAVQALEKDPINVKVDKEDLSVVRKSDELKDLVKDYYVETTVKINDEEVPAYKIEALDLTLVALKDDKGNIKFYTYDDGKYSLYQELSGGNLIIHFLDKGKYPANYKKYTVTIDGEKYTVYKLNKKSKYYLVYGENVETGKKGLYLYDSVDKSVQRYYTEEVESLNDELKINSYIIVGLTCLIVLLLIIFLIALHTKNSSKRKTKREIKKRLKQEKNDFLKD